MGRKEVTNLVNTIYSKSTIETLEKGRKCV